MTARLFVYGTLRPDLTCDRGYEARMRLMAESRIVAHGDVRGRLFDLGPYPGLVEARRRGSRVHGVLLDLPSPQATFRWLDPYEDATGTPTDEYVRILRRVTCSSGRKSTAWVYMMRSLPPTAVLLPDGSWPPAANHGGR
jgi:gamma-glutamylcyclotransferase (GGCT)/AIG2-like uncharacterized protein YtfP